MKYEIQKHSTIDKRFEFRNEHISMEVDYDDVNHPEVDAGIELMKEILDEYWNEDLFKKKYKEKIMEVWNENKYDIQSDYENNLEEYLTNFGL